MLSKIRNYVRAPLLCTIYFDIFDLHLRCGCQIWEQNENDTVENIEKIQNKAIRILNFKGPRAEASNLYKESKLYILKQITTTENSIKKNLPKNFNNYFTVKKNQHQCNARRKKLDVPIVNSNYYESNSITLKAIKQWNEVQDSLYIDLDDPEFTSSKFLRLIKEHITNQ